MPSCHALVPLTLPLFRWERAASWRTLISPSPNWSGGWRNKLIWGDNLLVMGALLEKFAGKIDLIYIDPPFATGADFSFVTQIGDGDLEMSKEPSIIAEKAYRDTWGAGLISYLAMMSERLALLRDLLSEAGSLFVHCDWHVGFLFAQIFAG